MSITDELRGWANGFAMTRKHYELQLLAIADRIDAEHEAQLNDAFETRNSDENLESDGWARLPVDAGGEYIHIGDLMYSKVDYLFDGRPYEVRALVLCEDGWEVADSRFGNRYEPNSLRHYHAPTVEDLLREFGRGWHEQMNAPETFDIADYVERYAAKLQLREDE